MLEEVESTESLSLEKKVIIYHLLKKFEILLNDKPKSPLIFPPEQEEDKSKPKVENVSPAPYIDLNRVRKLILSYIMRIGRDPSYNLLKFINKIIKG